MKYFYMKGKYKIYNNIHAYYQFKIWSYSLVKREMRFIFIFTSNINEITEESETPDRCSHIVRSRVINSF